MPACVRRSRLLCVPQQPLSPQKAWGRAASRTDVLVFSRFSPFPYPGHRMAAATPCGFPSIDLFVRIWNRARGRTCTTRRTTPRNQKQCRGTRIQSALPSRMEAYTTAAVPPAASLEIIVYTPNHRQDLIRGSASYALQLLKSAQTSEEESARTY